MKVKELLQKYEEKKDVIKRRLLEFRGLLHESDERIFAELVFCILTPQTNALICWDVVKKMMNEGKLVRGDKKSLKKYLRKIRFWKRKMEYVLNARKLFTIEGRIRIKDFLLSFTDPLELREWLVRNVKGMGMKEASHFIRNVGLSNNEVAILDRHVLRELAKYGVIDKVPKRMSRRDYYRIEMKMKDFSRKIGIPLDELDLLFWSERVGFVFK